MQPTTAVLSPSWFSALEALDAPERRRAYDALSRAVRDYPALRPEPVGAFTALRVSSADLLVIASVVHEHLVVFHVADPDGACRWALESEIDPLSDGLLPVRVAETPGAPVTPAGPLDHVGGRLERLGVPGPLAVLLSAASEEQALEIAALLPGPSRDAVLDLLGGESFAEAERRFVHARAPAETLDELDLLVAIEDHQLDQLLTEAQKRAVGARSRGAMKVSGGPGTGKTVVAVHRAHFLASVVFRGPILVTCPLPAFVGPLRRRVDERCADRADLRGRIEVAGLGAVAEKLVAGLRRTRASQAQRSALWGQVLEGNALGWGQESFEAERQQVLDRHDAWTWEAYRRAERVGRGAGLDEPARAAAWTVLEAFEQALDRAGLYDRVSLPRLARGVLQGGPRPWDAIVCDEVQDASPGELRLMAALSTDPSGQEPAPDALFLVGDGYQRVYGRPVALARCAIDVSGRRSRVLRTNYRTTEGIRQAAIAEIDGLEPDPLDAAEEAPNEGYRSLRAGFPPVRRTFESAQQELDYIVEAYLTGDGGMFVLARTEAHRDALVAGLQERGVAVTVLEADDDGEPDPMGVTVCTLHRSKGLETARVVVAGAHLVPQPYTGADEGERRWHEANERRLMYGGMQRAQTWLAVTRVQRR